MRSDRYLKRLYRYYNRKFFGNKLPNIIVGFSSPADLVKKGHGKKTCAVTLFDDNDAPEAILIKRYPHKHWSYIKLDLLHELCHVALPASVNHGPRFKSEMKRLERAGAFRKLL